ncbi:spore germination protein [Clostridium grantii]|uniref:Spore germination protein n=1 Tax=Clostridium grantii DSM 8605 TaxID=1121316 RepID=A0A1M5TL10_9CLOT|nr:spore germination protein [Clostridium grantii]SHH51366.1 spore germination protein [Clostridium grantii DSM 8605]
MKEWVKKEISKEVDNNISYLKEILKDNSDIVFREFYMGKWKAAFVYIDGMGDKLLLDQFVMIPLMKNADELKDAEEMKDKILTISDLREVEDFSKGVDAMLSGDTLMMLEGINKAYVIATRFWPARGVSEPSGETVVRGSREGFTETIRFNTALVRRRIRDTRLKVVPSSLGVRSKTDVVVMYMSDLVNNQVLEELNKRLQKINIDAVLDSGYIQQFIEDDIYSPFPQVQSTERPDVVAAAIYEGRTAILVDNSPFVLIVPATLNNIIQSPDDYNQRWMHASFVRITRVFALFISLILPCLYIAVTSFHTGIIPTKLAYSIAASREGVPFPAFVEVLIMEVSMALLLEAIVRLPRPIGATIGIVGGLIVGQAAVTAGIVSPIMIIIVASTAITEFVASSYEITSAIRMVRFGLIIAASIIGLYGIVLGIILLTCHLIKLKSFGIPYLAPAVNPNLEDQKDYLIRMPLKFFKKRPIYMNSRDKIRQK